MNYSDNPIMKFIRPRRVLAGFQAAFDDDPQAPLRQAGEQWLPQDRQINSHANDGWELLYQAKGWTDWKLGRHRFRVPTGGFYLIAPGVRHALLRCGGEDIHIYYTVFEPQRCLAPEDQFLLRDWPRQFHVGGESHSLAAPFQALMREVTLERGHHTGLRIQLAALCIEVHRLLGAKPTRLREASLHPAAWRARECLTNHPGHAWRLDELAALAGVSVPHLIEIFRAEFSETPMQYLRRQRLNRARALLRGGEWPITRIALETGFASSQHFASACRAHFGCSPKALRENHPG